MSPDERPVLDRIPFHDDRSRAYGLAEVRRVSLPSLTSLLAMSHTWAPGPVLNQGREGACSGFGVAGSQAARPQPWPDVDNAYARRVYEQAREVDRAAGRVYDSGATILGAVRSQVQARRAVRFEWAFSFHELIYGLIRRRPALFGVTWLESMFEPRQGGLLDLDGPEVGGHCLYGFAYTPRHRSPFEHNTITLMQSWGREHGDRGRVYVRAEEWWELLQLRGETCFLTDARPPRSLSP